MYFSGVISLKFVTFDTSFLAAYPASMDKVDYEAKLASEVEKLRQFQEALEAEHKQIESDASDGEPLEDPTLVATRIEQKLLKAADDAVDTMIHVLKYGDKDATRIAVAKYIVDHARKSPSADHKDPMDALLEKLTAET